MSSGQIMTEYHLAQANIARMLAPVDSETMSGFVALLDEINTLGENAPGFVWRLKDESGDATSIKVYDDDMIIINMSVWQTAAALYQFTYYSDHAAAYRRRREWFEKLSRPVFGLWWIPAGHTPTPDEAKARLEHLERHGASPYVFTFKERYTPADMLAYAGAVTDQHR